jgi:predicted DCC family thiol-disulfide oxidoreductase YuxK
MPLVIKNWLYDRIALNRYRLFGQKEQCLIPSAPLMQRFLG